MSKLAAAGAAAFLLLWPIFAIVLGISATWLFIVWFAVAIITGIAANSGNVGNKPKTMNVPGFGELTTTNWKKGAASYWSGKVTTTEAPTPIEIWFFCTDEGPSDAQRSLFERLTKDMSHLKTLAINALRALDRTEWPEAARDGTLELIAIELEDDEDTREDIFTLRFESPADPEADYYVDFRNDAVEGAYRVG